MINIFIFSTLSSIIFYFCGSILFSNKEKSEQTIDEICSQSIYGIIFISFVALVLNFFIPLGKLTNSIFPNAK